MFRIPLPTSDASLLLSPRWGELHGVVQFFLLLGLVFAPVALVVWLYRYELRLVRHRVALGLLALRLVVLLVLLFVFGFRPVFARTTTEELPGRVLVAVDRSASSDVTDPQRLPLDKLRLARALKLAGDVCTDQQMGDWIRQLEENRTPQFAEGQQAAYDEIQRRVDALTRSQTAKRVLAPDGVRLYDVLAGRHHVELLSFAQDAWDVKPDEDFQPGEGRDFTDLRLPLTRALERTGADQGRVLGVVVLTDGQHNAGPSPVPKAAELGEQQVPVFPIALGAKRPPPDVALAVVKAPATVFKDADVSVEARVKVSSLPPQVIVVELRRPDGPPLEERIRHDGSDRAYSVRFQTKLSQVGAQTMTVTAQPVQGETRDDNNSRQVALHVADDKAKVLILDGEARWEFHYLASALQRDRTVLPHGVVFTQPRLGRMNEEILERMGNPALTLPAGDDAFAGYDCVILGDVTPAQLPLADRVRLEKYVADRGGTLVIVAGKRAMPLGYLEAQAGEDGDPLARLLPVEEPQAVGPHAGFPVRLTHEGKLAPFLQMDAAPDKSEQRWADFPRHYWAVIGRAKPGAVPLAYYADEEPRDDKQAEREKQQALFVRQNYGFGRVLYVGIDSTWRWRHKAGDVYHHRFWGQVVRWAASDKPLVAGNDAVRFGTRAPVYQQGQEIDITVRLGDNVPPLPADARPEASILLLNPSEKLAASVPLSPREGQPRVLEGKLRDLPAGQYAVELAIPELADKLPTSPGPDGKSMKVRAPFTVSPPDSTELVELGTNLPLLEEIAAKSGGRVFTPENAAELAELLVKRGISHELHHEQRLWQWWGTLLVVLVLLTAEWAGRKWAGLP